MSEQTQPPQRAPMPQRTAPTRRAEADVYPDDHIEDDGALDWTTFRTSAGTVLQTSEREFKETVGYENFMAELVKIRIHTTSDPKAPPAVPVGINGELLWLPRGMTIRIPRRFVERLAQSQVKTYTQVRNPDHTAEEGVLTRHQTSQDTQFDVVHDPNPLGRRWLQRMLREGC